MWNKEKLPLSKIVQENASQKKREILNRWTEYCTELYNHKANGDPAVLACLQTDTEDDQPVLCKEVEGAVQSLKKGKSAGVDNIPAELVQAGGEGCNHRSHDNLQQDLADKRMANPMDPVPSHHTSPKRQPAASSARTTEQ